MMHQIFDQVDQQNHARNQRWFFVVQNSHLLDPIQIEVGMPKLFT